MNIKRNYKILMLIVVVFLLCVFAFMNWQTHHSQELLDVYASSSSNKYVSENTKVLTYMQNIFAPGKVIDESVMFTEEETVKTLLFHPDNIISVTSYDSEIIYKEGKDYILTNDTITVVKEGSIPVITNKVLYPKNKTKHSEKHNGTLVHVYHGEGKKMTIYQVLVSYEHSDKWDYFYPNNQTTQFQRFLSKLHDGRNVTIAFYGDSITKGFSSSFFLNYTPYNDCFSLLFTKKIASDYGYKVHYPKPTAINGSRIPDEDTVFGDKGIVTYLNEGIGGLTTLKAKQ